MSEKIRVPLSKPWIDDLLHERDELRAEVERLRDVAWQHGNRADEAEVEIERLKAELHRERTEHELEEKEADTRAERLKAALAEIGDAYRKIGEAPNSDIRDLARAHLFSVLLLNFGHPRK